MKREEEREWGEWEGVGKKGGNGNFYNLIKFTLRKKKIMSLKFPSRKFSQEDSSLLLSHPDTQGHLA